MARPDDCCGIRAACSFWCSPNNIADTGTGSGHADRLRRRAPHQITTAVRITEGIVLDGRLDEPVWQQVEVGDATSSS